MVNSGLLKILPKNAAAMIIALSLSCFGAGERKPASAEANQEHPSVHIVGPKQIPSVTMQATLEALIVGHQHRWEDDSRADLLQNINSHLNTPPEFHKSNPLPTLSLLLSDAYKILE